MKLYMTKSDEKELYFQLEKTNEGLNNLNKIVGILYDDSEFFFDMDWQNGFPKTESYQGYESKEIYIGATVSEKRIHLVIRGLKDKDKINKIKEFIFSNYDFIEGKKLSKLF